MESHRYQFAARDLLRTTLLPLLGAGFLLAAVRLADALALLPPVKPADDPDQTLGIQGERTR